LFVVILAKVQLSETRKSSKKIMLFYYDRGSWHYSSLFVLLSTVRWNTSLSCPSGIERYRVTTTEIALPCALSDQALPTYQRRTLVDYIELFLVAWPTETRIADRHLRRDVVCAGVLVIFLTQATATLLGILATLLPR
jgi:hypothetical protein